MLRLYSKALVYRIHQNLFMVLFTPKKLTFKGSKKQHQILAQTAYYQAGKIVVQTLLPEQPPIALITLNTLGTTCSTSADTYIPIENIFNTQSCSFLESRLVSLYGGKAASLLIEYQQRFANGVSTTSPQPTSDSSTSIAELSSAVVVPLPKQRSVGASLVHFNGRQSSAAELRTGVKEGAYLRLAQLSWDCKPLSRQRYKPSTPEGSCCKMTTSSSASTLDFVRVKAHIRCKAKKGCALYTSKQNESEADVVIAAQTDALQYLPLRRLLSKSNKYKSKICKKSLTSVALKRYSPTPICDNWQNKSDASLQLRGSAEAKRQTSAAELHTGIKEQIEDKARLVRTCFAGAGNNIFQSTLGNIEIQAATRLAKIMVNYWNFYSLNKISLRTKLSCDTLFNNKKYASAHQLNASHIYFSTEVNGASINSINKLTNFYSSLNDYSPSNAIPPCFSGALQFPLSGPTNTSPSNVSAASTSPEGAPPYLYKPGLLYKSDKSKSQVKKGLTLFTSPVKWTELRRPASEGENSATICNSWQNKEGLAELKDNKQKEHLHKKIEELRVDLQRERGLQLQLRKPSSTKMNPFASHRRPLWGKAALVHFSEAALRSSATLVKESVIPFTGDSERYAKRKDNVRVWSIKLKVKDKTPQGHIVYRIQNNLYFAIAQSKNSLKICENKNSSYNIQRLSIENIGNYSQLNNNNFHLINSLQFSNLQRDRFYTNWFRLYLPDMEATEFLKNTANYYFSLGLQTLTFPSTKSSYYFSEGKLGVNTTNPFLTFLNKNTLTQLHSSTSDIKDVKAPGDYIRFVKGNAATPRTFGRAPFSGDNEVIVEGVSNSATQAEIHFSGRQLNELAQLNFCAKQRGFDAYSSGAPTEMDFGKGELLLTSAAELRTGVKDNEVIVWQALANSFQPKVHFSERNNQLNVPFSLLLENQIFPLNYNGFLIVEKELLYNALVNSSFAKAFYLINQNRQLVDFLVDYLLRFQILRQHQILYLFSTLLLGCNKTA